MFKLNGAQDEKSPGSTGSAILPKVRERRVVAAAEAFAILIAIV